MKKNRNRNFFFAITFRRIRSHKQYIHFNLELTQSLLIYFREFSKLSFQEKSRQRQLWGLISLYLDSTQEVFEHKNKKNLSESKLLGKKTFSN